jgi:tetratricopeptide (TPR) repeat protein
VPDATFPEAIGQFLTKLGDRTDDPPTMDRETFERFIRAAASTGCDVIVFEQAQHLPLNEDSRNHPDLLGFLSQICGTDIRPLPRVILVSDLRGRLNFSGQHLLADIPLDGLAPPYDVELIRELLVSRPSSYDPPTSSELSTIVSQIHGHPMLTEIAASLLESYPASAVATTLHRRAEIRQYINTSLLGKLTLSAIERRFLLLASVFRIPVAPFAFAPISGAHTRSLTQDLVSRFLLHNDRDGLRLHPLLRDHFQQQITDQAEEQQLNELAFQYFEQLRKSARLSLDEQIEHIYHGQRCGAAISLHEVRILVSPIRSQMFQALSDRQYARVESAANKILELDPRDSVARLAMATALDARGRHREADTYFDSICDLDRRHRWVAIALAKSKIRTRDFQAAEHVLSEMQYRFGNGPWLDVVWAQLFEARGKLPEAEEKCVAVLKDQYCHPSDAFMSTLLLRAMNRFDLITAHLERHMPRFDQNDGIKRLFAHACVVSHFAPEDGLRFLNDLWVASPEDGRIIGDLAGALAAAGRVRPAEQLFRKGLLLCRTLRNDRPALLEEYARFLDTQDRFRESHTQYRELLGMRPHHTHLLRLFASSLLRAAAAAKASRDRVAEDAFAVEAKQVLSQLLQVAPEDSWASSSLEDAIHRNYGP